MIRSKMQEYCVGLLLSSVLYLSQLLHSSSLPLPAVAVSATLEDCLMKLAAMLAMLRAEMTLISMAEAAPSIRLR